MPILPQVGQDAQSALLQIFPFFAVTDDPGP